MTAMGVCQFLQDHHCCIDSNSHSSSDDKEVFHGESGGYSGDDSRAPIPMVLCRPDRGLYHCCQMVGEERHSSAEYPLPAPSSGSAHTIAALQGGPMAVVHTVVFDLWNRGLVEISGEKSKAQIVCRPAKETPGWNNPGSALSSDSDAKEVICAGEATVSFQDRIEGPSERNPAAFGRTTPVPDRSRPEESLAGIVRGPRGRDAGGWHQVVARCATNPAPS